MEDNKECSLIKDLFPIYIDNLTTKKTNEFINNHFSKCNKCLNEYNDLYRNWNFIKCDIYVLLL